MERFYGKVILFGEYTILHAGMALAMPVNKFYGNFVDSTNNEAEAQKSNKVLHQLLEYIQSKQFNVPPNLLALRSAISEGLWFNSDIPGGYGMGSSGAITAAVYHYFFLPRNQYVNIELGKIHADLALLESFFHGKSSGTDPLVSYLNRPVLLNAAQDVSLQNIASQGEFRFFLLDTNQTGKTKGLVDWYITMRNKQKQEYEELLKLTNRCIISLLEGRSKAFEQMLQLGELQQKLLSKMFVSSKESYKLTQEFGNDLVIKLCGSGGGGYFLGICKARVFGSVESFCEAQNISIVPLFTDELFKKDSLWILK